MGKDSSPRSDADALDRAAMIIVKRDRFCACAINQLVRNEFPKAQVSVCHTGAAAMAALQQTPAALGLLGLTLPDVDGLDLIIDIIERCLVSRLLVVSARNDEHSQQVLRRIGVAGFFDCSVEEGSNLITAVRRVASGGVYFTAAAHHARGAGPMLAQILSPTEMRVLAVIGDGASDQEATDQLNLSATTIHTHRQRIMRKLGIQSRAALMRVAIERGIVRFGVDRVFRPGMKRLLAAHGPAPATPATCPGAVAAPSPDGRVVAGDSSI